MSADNVLRLAFVLSATDKMSRVIEQAVRSSTDELSAFERRASKVGQSAVKAGAMMTGAGVAVGAALLTTGKSVADYAGSVNDMSEATGVGVEAWQKMTYAAKMSGIEQEKLSASMVKFDKLVAEAAGGSKTAGKVFKDLGISVMDASGKMRAPNEIFEDVAEIFAKTENGATKTALACEFFGKSGAELMPMLNEGKAGLTGLYEAAERTGNVLGIEAIGACDEFGKKVDSVGLQVKGLGLQVGAMLAPTLHELTNRVSDIIQRVTNWMQANPGLAETIGKVAFAGVALLIGLGSLSVVIGGLTFIVGKFGTVWRGITAAVKVGQAIFLAAKNSMLLFRIQYAAFVIWQKIATAAQWLFNTALAACPVVWVVAGIAAIVAAVVLLVKHWEKVTAFFAKVWDGVKKVFSVTWEWIKNLFVNYTPVGLIVKHWESITGWFARLWEKVKNIFRKPWEWIKNMFLNYTPAGLIIKHWAAISEWFTRLWNRVTAVFRNAWDGIKNLFLNYTPTGLIIKHWDAIVDWFANLWGNVKSVFIGVWDSIGTYFSTLKERFFEWGKNIIKGLIDGVLNYANKAIEAVENIGKKIAERFKKFFGINSPSRLFMEYGVNITQGLTGGISQGEGKVTQATEGLAMRATRNIGEAIQTNTTEISSASQVSGQFGAPTINYAPTITINGGADTKGIAEDFAKLLRTHRDEIVEIIHKDDQNRTRLAFG